MRRDFAALDGRGADLLVVGAGIYGACCAWLGALAGLDTVLIEAADFGSGTSANSLRTLHGGLRHLQRLDLPRMRAAIVARREWCRLAPGFVTPMRFVLPVSAGGLRGRGALRAALLANDVLSFDRNAGLAPPQHLGRGELWSPAELASRFPGLDFAGAAGAAVWQDAVCLNTERLLLAVVAAAHAAGARVVNYARALEPLRAGSRVCGARVRDELEGRQVRLAARFTLDATGPQLASWTGWSREPPFRASRAFNLVTRALPFAETLAVTERAPDGAVRGTWFVVPWNGQALIGTRHLPCAPGERNPEVPVEAVRQFVADINRALAPHRIEAGDVRAVLAGLLPVTAAAPPEAIDLERGPVVVDHARAGTPGLLSVAGAKWTSAREVATDIVGQVVRRLGRSVPVRSPLRPGGAGLGVQGVWGPQGSAVDALARADAALGARCVPDLPVCGAQLLHAARTEMAVRLEDLVRRRTLLWLSAELGAPELERCARLVARELRWSRREVVLQVEQCAATLARLRAGGAAGMQQHAA